MQWYPHEADVVTFYGPVAVLIISAVVVSLLRFIAAPYGRYQNTAFGFIIPARVCLMCTFKPLGTPENPIELCLV